MAMQGPPPPARGMNPQDYYNTLVSQGMRPYDAYQAVQANFGAPPTRQQQAEKQASAEQRAAIGQTAGAVGGALATREALTGFPNIKSAFGYGDKFAESGRIGITRPVPAETLDLDAIASGTPTTGATVATPKLIKVEGNVATVELPGGKVDTLPKEALNDPGFMKDIDWGKVGQGAVGALQLYQAYNMAKNKDYAGAGIYGVGGAANIAASGLVGAGAETAAANALGGYLMPGVNIAMGAYGAYKTAEMTGNMAAGKQRDIGATASGAASGAAIGTAILPGIGTAIGAGVGALAGYTGSKFGSHKGKAQFMRDNIRSALQQGGVLDKDYKGTLADGSTYDFGKDGKALKWKNIDKLAAENPNSWNAAVPLTDALATAYGFVGQKASDISAWYAKGAISNASNDPAIAIKNAQHFAKQQGITYDQIKTKLDEAIADNRISKSQYDYYLGGARQLTAGMPKTSTPTVSTRPPAPNPPQVSAGPIQTSKKKQSIGDVLRSNMSK